MAPGKLIDGPGFDIFIRQVPSTIQRLPFYQNEGEETLKLPGTARANLAVSAETPNGTEKWAANHKHQTVLQQHISFFDPDKDGIIWPSDIYTKFRDLGFNFLICIFAVLFICPLSSLKSRPHFFPDPFFRIYLSNINKVKHASDSATFDNEGRYIPQMFEDIFAKYASGDKQSITGWEIYTYLGGKRVGSFPQDVLSWTAAIVEWAFAWYLLKDANGRVQKDDIRRIYDGSMFFDLEARHAKKS
ncbi:hypothetical protein B7494_g4520 [Chlorociboria aeruginascens]|nr:hypothetical protein B7494_g4520 [Chlorociboria aeruginascens]